MNRLRRLLPFGENLAGAISPSALCVIGGGPIYAARKVSEISVGEVARRQGRL